MRIQFKEFKLYKKWYKLKFEKIKIVPVGYDSKKKVFIKKSSYKKRFILVIFLMSFNYISKYNYLILKEK